MNSSTPSEATGQRLRNIREEAGFGITEAVDICNLLAKKHNSNIEFNEKKLRKFESIGVTPSYGTKPPSYEELQLMMRAYGGSLSYLIWGVLPARFDVESNEFGYADPLFERHITWLASLPQKQRTSIIKLVETALLMPHSD